MANASILAAFERMWQHINIALNNKSDTTHKHDDVYIQKTNITDNLTTTSKDKPLSANQGYVLNQSLNGVKRSISNLQNDVDDLVDTAVTEEFVNQAIETVKNDLLNGAGEAYDTLKELGDLINENTDAIGALETIAINKVDKADVYTKTEVDVKIETAFAGIARAEEVEF